MAFTYETYHDSEDLKRKIAKLEEAEANKPEYSYENEDAYKQALDRVLNREKFSYDASKDALFQAYRDSAMKQGKLAMQDSMAQASQLTGGYANSYAQQAGQQSYNAYLQKINDALPQYYQMAKGAYDDETNAILNRLGVLQSDRENAYGRYRDTVGDWQTDLARLASEVANQRNLELSEHQTGENFRYNDYTAERSNNWQNERDERSYEQAEAMARLNSQLSLDNSTAIARLNYEYGQKEADAALGRSKELAKYQSKLGSKSSSISLKDQDTYTDIFNSAIEAGKSPAEAADEVERKAARAGVDASDLAFELRYDMENGGAAGLSDEVKYNAVASALSSLNKTTAKQVMNTAAADMLFPGGTFSKSAFKQYWAMLTDEQKAEYYVKSFSK